jgi:predicted RNase H-like HicB family nuclease
MQFYHFEIIIEKEPEDEGYFAYSPTLPGCFSNGKTIEETKRNIREAITQHLEFFLIVKNSALSHVSTSSTWERVRERASLNAG